MTEQETLTPEESEDLENFFAEDLDRERFRAGEWIEATERVEGFYEEPEQEQESAEPKDPFDIPPKKTQKNWLANRIEGRPERNTTSKGIRQNRKRRAIRESIQVMIAAGVKKSAVARLLGMTPANLSNNYHTEMEYGSDILTTRMVNILVQKGLDGNVPAIIFYLKSKAGWKEADKSDLQDADRAAISSIERNQRLMALFMSNPQLLEQMKQRRLAATPVVEEIDPPLDITPDDEEEDEDKDIFDV